MPPLKNSHRTALDAYFDGNKRCAFNLDGLSDLIAGNRATWGFPKSWSIQHITRILLEGGWLQARSGTPKTPSFALGFQCFQQFRGICFSLEVSPESAIT